MSIHNFIINNNLRFEFETQFCGVQEIWRKKYSELNVNDKKVVDILAKEFECICEESAIITLTEKHSYIRYVSFGEI